MHLFAQAVLPKHSTFALQGSESFNRQVLEELMHKVLPQGGNFPVR